MDIWTTLGIEATQDEQLIKRSYAKLIKTIDQTREAARFQQVREAYDLALQYSRHRRATHVPVPASDSLPPETETQAPTDVATDDLNDTDVVKRPAPTMPKAEDVVAQDIQVISGLLQQDQKQAVQQLKQLLTSERYDSLVNRERLEWQVLFLIYQSEVFPYRFTQAVHDLFGWNQHENPFRQNAQYRQIYTMVVHELARQRAKIFVINSYQRHKPPLWTEVENIVFGGFNQARLEQIAADPDSRIALKQLFRFILQQNFHPNEIPVPAKTYQWVLQHLQETNPPPPQTRQRTRSGGSRYYILIFGFIALVQLIPAITSHDEHHPKPAKTYNDFLEQYNKQHPKADHSYLDNKPNKNTVDLQDLELLKKLNPRTGQDKPGN